MILDEKLATGSVHRARRRDRHRESPRLGGEMNAAAWCGVANWTTSRHGTPRARVLSRSGRRRDNHQHLRDLPACAGRRRVSVTRPWPSTGARSSARARRETGWRLTGPVAVAGSMSNTVAWRPGTIGPDPAYLPSPEKEAANYREMADTLAEAGCDLLVMEMLMDVEHGARVTEAALATGLPVWVGISTSPRPRRRDDRLGHRERGGRPPSARL